MGSGGLDPPGRRWFLRGRRARRRVCTHRSPSPRCPQWPCLLPGPVVPPPPPADDLFAGWAPREAAGCATLPGHCPAGGRRRGGESPGRWLPGWLVGEVAAVVSTGRDSGGRQRDSGRRGPGGVARATPPGSPLARGRRRATGGGATGSHRRRWGDRPTQPPARCVGWGVCGGVGGWWAGGPRAGRPPPPLESHIRRPQAALPLFPPTTHCPDSKHRF